MRLRKLIDYHSKRWYIIKMGEKNGIKIGACIEEAYVKGEYEAASKKEQKSLEPYLKGDDLVKMKSGQVFNIERENRRFNLATIYYRDDVSTGLSPVVIDIHYHLNHSDNGYRTKEEIIKIVNDLIFSLGYQKDLVIGGFTRTKKHKSKNTSCTKRHSKVYTKVE